MNGLQGPYFIGNLQFPASIDVNDVIVKVIPEDEGDQTSDLMALLQELLGKYDGKFYWSVCIEPRRKTKPKK